MRQTRPTIYKVTVSFLIFIILFVFLIKNFWTIIGIIIPNYYFLTKGSTSSISGKAMCISDVSTMPDSPMKNIVILAIPKEKFNAWIISKPRTYGRLIISKSELFDKLYTTTDLIGYYNLKLNPGNYSFCYAWTDNKSDEIGISGCINIALGINKIEQVNINECNGTGIWCKNKSACSINSFSSVIN